MVKASDESWRFSGALYVSKGKGFGFIWVGLGIMFTFSAAMSLPDDFEDITVGMVIRWAIFAICATFLVISLKKYLTDSKTVHLAVFNDHIVILPIDKSDVSAYDGRDATGYVRIPYKNVVEYTLYHYSAEDDNGSIKYYNHGELRISTKEYQHRAYAGDIETIRKFLAGIIPVRETMQGKMW